LHAELQPQGLEVVTVALDTAGVEAAGPWIDAAAPEHPSLIDQAHVLDELLGIVNVPSGVWIDESGVLVRPPETAWSSDPGYRKVELPADADPRRREAAELVSRLTIDSDAYVSALRDWVVQGAASPFALAPDEVVRRSAARPPEAALAAASFELGQHLHRAGHAEDAVPYFRDAHRLQPANWTYKRQAWALAGFDGRPNDVYDGDWIADVKVLGVENYYPALDL
jgi:hypothetical protein